MKNTKCPNKRLCWGYMNGGCDTCSAGAEVNRIYKRIDRLKKQNEKLTIQRNAWFLTAKAMKEKWISVDEQLPDNYRAVLVVCESTSIGGGTRRAIGSYGGGFWSLTDTDGTHYLTKYMQYVVTHWMELPEFPKESEDER